MTFKLGPLPPVPMTLAAAVAAAPTIPSRWEFAHEGDTEPDFGAMFTAEHNGPILDAECAAYPDEDCEACMQVLSPRLAWLLHTGAEVAVDHWREAAAQGEDWFFYMTEDELPPVAQQYAARTPGWLEQMAATVRDLGMMVAAGQVPYPNSTAQEMALHIVLDHAEGYLETVAMDRHSDWDSLTELPVHGASGDHDDDLDFALEDGLSMLRDVLFEDHDVLMLFNPQLDGIESDETIGETMGLTNLHPRDWFTPFRGDHPEDVECEQVDPDVTNSILRLVEYGRGGFAHEVVNAIERHGFAVATLDTEERAAKLRTVVKSVAGRRTVRYRSTKTARDGQIQVTFHDPARTPDMTAGDKAPIWKLELAGRPDSELFGGWLF